MSKPKKMNWRQEEVGSSDNCFTYSQPKKIMFEIIKQPLELSARKDKGFEVYARIIPESSVNTTYSGENVSKNGSWWSGSSSLDFQRDFGLLFFKNVSLKFAENYTFDGRG